MFGRKRLLRGAVHHRFVITLDDANQTTFDGLLVDSDSEVLVLTDVKVLTDERQVPQPVDGLVYLLRKNVDYMQAPRSAGG